VFSDQHLHTFNLVVRDMGLTAYLCGGTVRDLMLNRPIHDVDLVLSEDVFGAAQRFAARMKGAFFIMDRERKVARVVFDSGSWDFTGFRNHTIEGDLEKRDFTINAMAIRWQDFYPDRTTTVVL